MKLRRLLSVRDWSDRAREVALRAQERLSRSRQPLSPFVEQWRSRVTMQWPRRYEWPMGSRHGDQLRDMFRPHIDVVQADVPQPYKGTIVAMFVVDGTPHRVAFVISDYPDWLEERCVDESLVTFKFQFRDEGYADPRVIPGGYVPGSALLYSMLPQLRRLKDSEAPSYEVYGRFSAHFAPTVRGNALRRLHEAKEIRFEGGLELVRYSRNLRQVAQSRICIDLPGNGPLCFRLIEYLAVGACIVGHRHGVRLPGGLVSGVHGLFVDNDPEAMIDACRTLAADPARQAAMVRATREFFDTYLQRDRLASYYLGAILSAAGVAPAQVPGG